MTAIIYRHPEGQGAIVADADNLRLCISNTAEASEVSVSIGPDGLRALAEKLRQLADQMEVAQ